MNEIGIEPSWAATCGLQGARERVECAMIATRNLPHLMEYLFHPAKPQLAQDTDKIVEAGGLSGGEKVLVRFCVDLWNRGAKLPFIELARLDQDNFQAALEAMVKARRYGFM